MKNRNLFKIAVCICVMFCLLTFCGESIYAQASEEKVYLGGFTAGFNIKSRGADIVGMSDVITDMGVISPAKDSGITVGDRLLNIDNTEINSSKDIEKALENNNGEKVVVIVNRKGEKIVKEVMPAKDLQGTYRLGLFIRDNLNGIGTMTFIKQNGEFMALGHPIVDENNNLCDIVSGNLYRCSIIGVNKGVRGKAGELKGIFIKDDAIGCVTENLEQGLRGKMNKNYNYGSLKEVSLGEVSVGDAKMVTSIDGVEPKEYSISIVKADNGSKTTKNFVVKITDERLLKEAGGIVQGMSGSPVIQNGKLVGAVTHVFLNDPTRGYGICIGNMLSA